MGYTDILDIIPTMQSIALVKENTKKKDGILKKGVKNIVGIQMTTSTANLI